jgi:CHASE2 domain-containing sensor protein
MQMHERPTWKGFARHALPLALAAACLLSLDPLRIEEATASFARSFVMRLSAALYPSFLDGPKGDDVSVVLIDEDYLAGLNSGWPLGYRKQGDLLARIASYSPQAIFVDIIYERRHEHPGSVQPSADDPALLSDALLDSETDIFFAAFGRVAADDADSASTTRSGDCGLAEEAAATPSRLDAARFRNLVLKEAATQRSGKKGLLDLAFVDWQGCAGAYPLQFASDPALRSPALAMYQSKYPGVVPQGPLVPRWGAFVPVVQSAFYKAGICQFDARDDHVTDRGGIDAFVLRARVLFHQLSLSVLPSRVLGNSLRDRGPNAALPCPAVNVIPASKMVGRDSGDPDLKNAFEGRFVLLGASQEIAGDMITSPVHGELAGVLLHATALDNLLRADAASIVRPMPAFWSEALPFIVLVASAATTYFFGGSAASILTLIGGSVALACLATMMMDRIGWLGADTAVLGHWQLAMVTSTIILAIGCSVALWRKGLLAGLVSAVLAFTFVPNPVIHGVWLTLLALAGVVILWVVSPAALFRATCAFSLVTVVGVLFIELGWEPFNILTLGIAVALVSERVHADVHGPTGDQQCDERFARIELLRHFIKTAFRPRPEKPTATTTPTPPTTPPTTPTTSPPTEEQRSTSP